MEQGVRNGKSNANAIRLFCGHSVCNECTQQLIARNFLRKNNRWVIRRVMQRQYLTRHFIGFVFLLFSQSAYSLNWTSSDGVWNSTRMLAPGQTEAIFSMQLRQFNENLSVTGKSEALGARSAQTAKTRAGDLHRSYKVQLEQTRFTPTWAFGLTKTWMLAARMGFSRLKAKIATEVHDEEGARRNELMPAFYTQSKSAHYFNLSENEERHRVGQFEIRSKHRLRKTPGQTLVLFETLRLPTAENEDLDYLMFTEIPPQSIATGVGAALEAHLNAEVDFSLMSELTHHFPDEVYARQKDGFLTDEKMDRELGPEVVTDVAAKLRSRQPVSMKLGYRYQYQYAGELKGDAEDLQAPESQTKSAMYLAFAYAPPRQSVWRNDPNFSAHLEWENLLSGRNIENANTLSVGVSSNF